MQNTVETPPRPQWFVAVWKWGEFALLQYLHECKWVKNKWIKKRIAVQQTHCTETQILKLHFVVLLCFVRCRHRLDLKWCVAWQVFWLCVCVCVFLQRFSSVALRWAPGFCLPPYICANRWAEFDSGRTQYSLLLPLLTRQKDEQAARTTPSAPRVSHILKLKPKKTWTTMYPIKNKQKKPLFKFNFFSPVFLFQALTPDWKIDGKKQISVIYSKAGITTQPWAPDMTTHTHESLHARASTHTVEG